MRDDLKIEEVVDLLGLIRNPKSLSDATSFNVRCPLCDDKKYHCNINTRKNVYHCVRCSGDNKNTGVLDLYGRVRFGTPHIPGSTGNGKELMKKLKEELGKPEVVQRSYARQMEKKKEFHIPAAKITSDDKLHEAYSALLDFTQFALSAEHRDNLLNRGLDLASIIQNEYRTIPQSFDWINMYPAMIEIWEKDKLEKEKARFPSLKRVKTEACIGGMIVADYLTSKGIDLMGVPGAYKLKKHWIFNLQPGMIIPTRNREGMIVCFQLRKDTGKLRYMTISAKDLPYGVVEGISRVHFPLGNVGPGPESEVFLTEGPLKADVACHLYNHPSYFIALQGVNSTNELPEILEFLKACDVKYVCNALDMDRLCNHNVAKASKSIAKKVRAAGLTMKHRFWDADYASEKWAYLKSLCDQFNVWYDNSNHNVFVQIGLMAEALTDAGVRHSIKTVDGKEEKDYWNDSTKGIDDFLKWQKN